MKCAIYKLSFLSIPVIHVDKGDTYKDEAAAERLVISSYEIFMPYI